MIVLPGQGHLYWMKSFISTPFLFYIYSGKVPPLFTGLPKIKTENNRRTGHFNTSASSVSSVQHEGPGNLHTTAAGKGNLYIKLLLELSIKITNITFIETYFKKYDKKKTCNFFEQCLDVTIYFSELFVLRLCSVKFIAVNTEKMKFMLFYSRLQLLFKFTLKSKNAQSRLKKKRL